MFEPNYKATTELKEVGSIEGSQRFAIEFSLSFKESQEYSQDSMTMFELPNLNRKGLSKGKKIIMALCIVMAFNDLNKSRAFLFDEVDHALDTDNFPSYVKILKHLIKEGSQVLVTSFQQRMLNYSEMKIFKVDFDKCSRVKEISYDDAEKFLKDRES